MQKPLILVCNDDGITAPGISYVVQLLKNFGDVAVVAPDKPQSGMGHAITINSTLRVNKTNYHDVFLEYNCSGTPVDCVKMAVNKLLPRKPDLCVSGINHGSNSSINVVYSGTMSAALEGALEQIPSIGFSLCDYAHEADFAQAEVFIKKIIADVLKNSMPLGVCLNVNIPKLKADEIKGIKVCRQARANWVEEFDERKDPGGKPYYWLTGKFVNFEEGNKETDEWALKNGYISIVPTKADLTSYESLIELKSRYNEIGSS
ncbi:MAG: 5'/3'-nucleotidase SurE [Bacteroidia bacterium]|nr:5'/3'-nucleotidase SurE [Bacteroidia bacterium]